MPSCKNPHFYGSDLHFPAVKSAPRYSWGCPENSKCKLINKYSHTGLDVCPLEFYQELVFAAIWDTAVLKISKPLSYSAAKWEAVSLFGGFLSVGGCGSAVLLVLQLLQSWLLIPLLSLGLNPVPLELYINPKEIVLNGRTLHLPFPSNCEGFHFPSKLPPLSMKHS